MNLIIVLVVLSRTLGIFKAATCSGQRSHYSLKGDKGGSVGRTGSHEGGDEAAEEASPSGLVIDRPGCISPPRKPRLTIGQPPAQRIRHDALFDNVGRICSEPKELRAEATGPKVDGGLAERRVLPQRSGQNIVGGP